MSAFKSRSVSCCLVCVASLSVEVFADDAAAPKPEEFFPETTLLAVAIPDLEAARKAASNSRVGKIFAQPEMRAFVDPILVRITNSYAACRGAEPRLPPANVFNSVLFTGELAV